MSNPIRARVKGGVIEPLEQIDLPEGQEVMVTILAPTDHQAFQRRAVEGHTRRRGPNPQYLC